MYMYVLMKTYIGRKTIFHFLITFAIITFSAWMYILPTGLPHLENKRNSSWSKDTSNTLAMRPIKSKTDDELIRRINHMRRICNTNMMTQYLKQFRFQVEKTIYTYTPLERFTSKDVCYCKIPKSGSTFWGRALYMISHPEQADKVETYSGTEVHGELFYKMAKPCTGSMINNSQSFMVTRDPWTRLYSAYIDKVYLEKFGEFTADLLKFENGMSRGTNDSKVSLEHDCQGRTVSFELFLKRVVEWALSEYQLDPHFAPVALLCDPCHYDYTFFIKQERLKEETNLALDFLEVPDGLRSRLDMTQEENYIQATVPNLVMTTMAAFERNNRSCLTKNDMYQRIWRVLQIQGLVSEVLAFPKEVFDNHGSSIRIARALKDYVLEKRLETDAARKQRIKFLEKAYVQVERDVLRKVQGIFAMDFVLFEYGVNPVHTTASADT